MNHQIKSVSNSELRCTLVSIVPFAIREYKPGLIPDTYYIPPASEEKPQILHIGNARHNVYIDETRGSLSVRDGSDEVARSLVEDFINSQLEVGEGCYPGLFWIPGELSISEVKVRYQEEWNRIRLAHRQWLLAITKLADRDWKRYQNPMVVSDFQREAGRILGLKEAEHGWMGAQIEDARPMTECPACGMKINLGLAICPNCKVILDADKAKELTFAK